MDDYVSKVIGTANKLNSIGFPITEEWVGSFLLAGLTDEYKPFIMGIESSGTTISGDSIRSRLFEMAPSVSVQSAFFIKNAKKKNIKCEECGKMGHNKSRCFRLLNKKRQEEDSSDNNKSHAFSAVASNNRPEKGLFTNSTNGFLFYLDSGASNHLIANGELLHNTRPTTIPHVDAANKGIMAVKYAGDITIELNGNTVLLKNVLYVPGLAENLLSVSKIT